MTTTFLLIRHAPHVQLDRVFSGRTPGVPLSEEGRERARALGARLAETRIDRVEHSPLDRTRETAALIAAAQPTPPPVVAAEPLLEIDLGEWTGRALDSFAGDPAWRAWNERRGSARIPGGETMAEAQARIVDHLAALASKEEGRTIAVVTHADMVRAAVAYVLRLPLDDLLRFDVDPASVSRVVWGGWGGWGEKLLSLNETLA